MRANNSIKWVNEWGENYGQVGSGYVPVANRLSYIASCVLADASRTMLSVAPSRKGSVPARDAAA